MNLRKLLLVFILGAGSFAQAAPPPPTFTREQLRADLVELKRALNDMPPDLYRTASREQLERQFQDIESAIDKSPPLDRDAVWRLFATLNPILADGHLFVGFVDWRGDARAYLANGGRLFPFEVSVSSGCELAVRNDKPWSNVMMPHDSARILEVNGVPAGEICRQMMARAHGDTPTFRADLLSRRFWFFYWKLYGAPAAYKIEFDPGDMDTLEGRTELPELLAIEDSFDRQFELSFVADDPKFSKSSTAILKLGSFAWRDKDQLLAFTRASFESLRRWQIRNLVIDLRDNGGGNDDQWIEGVMPYVATKPWRTASTYRKRVVTADPARGEVVGAVVDGEIETWNQPQPENPLRFAGDVYVAVGPGTYSSAVVMATVFQDFGFGKVIGTTGSVRANSSGGARRTTLTHSGLIVVSPRFVLARPSGAKQPELLTPDISYPAGRSLVDFSWSRKQKEADRSRDPPRP
jgi:hypothetical protein